MLQMIAREHNLIFIEETEIFTLPLSQKCGRPISSNSIFQLEQTKLMMLPRTRKAAKIPDSNTVWHLWYMKCMETSEPREQEICC
jgi:hypothetical protein